MNRTIDTLRTEHRNFEKVLDVLEQELSVFARCARPDYELVQTIILYFQEYPTRCHHPKEDLIFDKLKRRDQSAAQMVGDFQAEHREQALLLRNFAILVDSIRTDHDLARRVFISAVRDFIDFERRHIDREERLLFPAAAKGLWPQDWQAIEQRLSDETDPLFSASAVEVAFRGLRDRIVQWERDNEAYRAAAM